MENQDLPEKKDKKPSALHRHWKLLVAIVVVLTLAGLSGWQFVRAKNFQTDNQKKNDTIGGLKNDLKDKTATITGLESRAASLNDKVVSLETALKELQEGSSYQAPTYDLTIGTVRQETIIDGGIEDDANKRLLVTVTVKNTSSSNGYVGPLDFTLKNSNDEKQPNYKEHSHYTNYYNSTGAKELLDQSLPKDDTAKGTLLFIVGKNDKDFTLRFNDQTYDISLD